MLEGSRRLAAALAVVATAAAFRPALGDGDFQPRFRPTIHVSRAAGPITIDGDLDDPGWAQAAVADHFAEVGPGDQVEPPVQSQARITYDDTNLYVALVAEDDPEAVRISLRDRDNIFTDDYFGILFDTYGDLTWGYEIFVNPLGVQGDLRVQADGTEDMAFDVVWDSKGKVTDAGYQVEIAIPFASLRFPDKPEQTWRVNFWRDQQREVRRRYAWAAINRDDPCWMCQWGTLTGIENIQPGKNVEVIANAVGHQSGALEDSSNPRSSFHNENVDGELSLNLRYGVTSNSSAELTINPDFSQVESDQGQIDVNTPFALFYSEQRPFFQEGSDRYNTWITAIYTRSINSPDLAAKFTGQFDRTSVVYTVARDDASPMILPFEEKSDLLLLGKSTSNIIRVRQTLKEDAYVGALATDRRLDGGGAGSVVSVDGTYRVLRNYRFEFQAAASRTEEPNDTTLTEGLNHEVFDRQGHTAGFDGESFWGHAFYASLERSARKWNADFDYWEFDPTFRTDNGFTTRNDYRQTSLWNGITFQPNREWLIDWEPSLDIGRIWDYDKHFQDEWLRPRLYLNLKGQNQLTVEHLWSRERFSNRIFPGISLTALSLDSRFSEILRGGLYARFGHGIYRDFDAPELGQSLDLSAEAGVKPTPRLEIEPSWSYSRMRSRIDGRTLFDGYIVRTRTTYNFTREWHLRLVVQYDDFRERLDLEPLLTYELNPFTVFYIGSSSRVQRYEPGDVADPPVLHGADWQLASRQFFAKLQYLLRF